MEPSPDYCPFCGARLRDDQRLEQHLDEHDECRERFDAWQPTQQAQHRPTQRSSGLPTLRGAVLVVIVLAVLGYSLLIAQQVLLGLLVSSVVVLAFAVWNRY